MASPLCPREPAAKDGVISHKMFYDLLLKDGMFSWADEATLMKIYHGITWYTMVFHGIWWYYIVMHGIPWFPWYIIVFYHGLPWFVCFKTPWYLPLNTMVYFHKGIHTVKKCIFILVHARSSTRFGQRTTERTRTFPDACVYIRTHIYNTHARTRMHKHSLATSRH